MALHFHTLSIQKIVKDTIDSVVITFDIPPSLEKEFQFTQGQNITLKANINGEDVRRSYSICTSPNDKTLSVAVKKVPNGLFSSFANEVLKKGDTLEVMQPTGNFNTPLSNKHQKKYVAFACGSGITPILSILKTTLIAEPLSEFTLVYSNRSRASIMFFETIESLKNQFVNRLSLIHLLSREKTEAPLNYGRINTEKLTQLQKVIRYQNIDEYFICGPEEMIFTTRDYLLTIGIDQKKIHFELFASSTPKKNIAQLITEDDNTPKSNITVKLDGRSFNFKLAYNSASILDAALREGADLPFACKGGVCCTCKAKLLQGEINMDVNYALEPEEVADGYILTCQSHPITDNVIVDFDVK